MLLLLQRSSGRGGAATLIHLFFVCSVNCVTCDREKNFVTCDRDCKNARLPQPAHLTDWWLLRRRRLRLCCCYRRRRHICMVAKSPSPNCLI